ncbi:hypothetical protein ACFQ4Y_01795 [Kroppenstedtia sanguinis]|uniref:Uncharacterized protein n=1 Tax=Kroppenstedtia sanguinis TaxID=1380684 RepID=A0ABW4C504_9BACL
MKQNTLLFDLLQSLYSCDEWAELARVNEYQDAARKFSSYDLWVAAAIGQWTGFRYS